MVEVGRALDILGLTPEHLDRSALPLITRVSNKSGKTWYEFFSSLSEASSILGVPESKLTESYLIQIKVRNYNYTVIKIFHWDPLILPCESSDSSSW